MANNEISQQVKQHVIQVPSYLKNNNTRSNLTVLKMSETLKLLSRDQALSYVKEEFVREFGEVKKFRAALANKLKAYKLRLRLVEDQGNVIIFANDSRSKE